MKVLINRKPLRDRAWGGGNLFVSALCDILIDNGIDVVHNLSNDIDIIFMQDPRYSELQISINEISMFKQHKENTKIIHRVNECDARKNTTDIDKLLRECSTITDHTVFVSNWMKDYHLSRGWRSKNNHVIYNGVNKDHFSQRDKINNGKINIVTHHWSSNRLKGFDIYDELDKFVKDNDKFTFTYIGRCESKFINTKIINPLFGLALGKELSRYDVYVSGSLSDPGPNHILESLACNIPTYVLSAGGGAVEFAGISHSYNTFSDLVKILELEKYKPNKYIPHTWESCINEYLKIITQ